MKNATPTNEPEPKIAVYCDVENLVIGAEDAELDFDIGLVMQSLLHKGDVIVKRAYCDWGRYRNVARSFHESGFELIEVPRSTMAGKNSADIRLVVDALDLCYTKLHVNTFVIMSGDSDFTPLVNKLKENNKTVLAIGLEGSSSDLLIDNCDEFIYYEHIAKSTEAAEESSPRQREALDFVVGTAEAMIRDRGGHIWSSHLKQTIKRKRPGFSEGSLGFKNFNQLLERAQNEGLLELERDDKSGGYLILAAE